MRCCQPLFAPPFLPPHPCPFCCCCRTDCRSTIDGSFKCESRQRSIFLGIANGEDLIYTHAGTSVPSATGVFAYNGSLCPVTPANLPTLPVRSYKTCVDMADDMKLGSVIVVNLGNIPKHHCYWDQQYTHPSDEGGDYAGQTRAEPVWNAGVEGVEWDEQVVDMMRLDIATRARYPILCAIPLIQYREHVPPSPPVSGPGSRNKIVEDCKAIRDPCDCCTSEEVNANACLPPAHGSVHTIAGVALICASQTDLADSDTTSSEAATICENIRPFCYPSKRSVIFSPLAGSHHDTKCSSAFYLDIYNRFQGIAVGTGAGTPNALVYLSRPDVVQRPLDGDPSEDAVAVATARIGGSLQLICFANSNARNRCHRITLDPQFPSFIQDFSSVTAGRSRHLQTVSPCIPGNFESIDTGGLCQGNMISSFTTSPQDSCKTACTNLADDGVSSAGIARQQCYGYAYNLLTSSCSLYRGPTRITKVAAPNFWIVCYARCTTTDPPPLPPTSPPPTPFFPPGHGPPPPPPPFAQCVLHELRNDIDDPIKYQGRGVAPLFPYPESGPIHKDGQVTSTQSWDTCIALCQNTPG